MSALPTQVNILGTIFTVVETDLKEDTCGDSTQATRQIRINKTLPPAVKVETFYHELVHMMLDHMGYDAIVGEQVAEGLAQGLGVALTYITAANELPRLTNE